MIKVDVKPNILYDKSFEISSAKLLPGEYFATSEDMMIVTVLGSCVAACIRDTKTGIGGMNHFMLPENNQEQSVWGNSSARYGGYAMEVLINQVLKLGAKRSQLEAKLFGGAAVIKYMKATNVGERNAQFGLEYLQTEGISVVSTDLLSIYPRKVHFFPRTGRVLVKKLYGLHSNQVVTQEQRYRSRLQENEVVGDIELFT